MSLSSLPTKNFLWDDIGAQTDPVYKGRLSGSVNAWYDRESKTIKKRDVTTPIVLQ